MTQADVDQSIKSEMEKMVSSYDDYMKRATFGREAQLRQVTVELAGVKLGDTVLEVGCATGSLTLAAKKAAGPNGRVFGIDIIPGMIEASKKKAAETNEEIDFREASIADLPFGNNFFDVVLSSFMIFHMSEETRRKGILEVQRVLKPGGCWLILDLSLPTQKFQRMIAESILGFSANEDLRGLIPVLESAGFTSVEYGTAKFRIFGLSLIGFTQGIAKKN
jgi:ubiquinone/menaquinone biosynthesis C-methylase UbiE